MISNKTRLTKLEQQHDKLKPVHPVKVIVDQGEPTGILRRYSDGKPMLINIGVKDFSQ